MNARKLWSQILIGIGTLAMLVGAVDPLEGSLIILPGSGLVLLGTFLGSDRRALIVWIWIFSLVAVGVGAMFVLSAFGGFGGKSGLSMWWGLLMLPYPIGWVMGIVSLTTRLVKNFRRNRAVA